MASAWSEFWIPLSAVCLTLLARKFDPQYLYSLLFEIHLLIENVFIAEKTIQHSFDVAYPIQSHLHLQVLILQYFCFFLELLEASLLVFELGLMSGALFFEGRVISIEEFLLCSLFVDVVCYVFLLTSILICVIALLHSSKLVILRLLWLTQTFLAKLKTKQKIQTHRY